MSDRPICAIFPLNKTGRHLANLFIASSVFGILSFGFSMVFAGSTSIWLIPAAFSLTLIHHVVTRCKLTRSTHLNALNANSPAESRFSCLRHAANMSFLTFLALAWLAGGILNITFHALNMWELWPNHAELPPANVLVDLTSACAAIVESGLLVAIAVFCWKLGKEAKLERSRTAILEQIPEKRWAPYYTMVLMDYTLDQGFRVDRPEV
ncbi:hypothetical protein CTheo_1780 [Ceratobasidium theobromae]|uniref:Transmembrane protein n=1 Tax=Ceratobasidium theobromae TaxID=1582974 RepID=A0A5N5QTA3_9AGAM|nr:hypothetical protein CTheo_1780 [Ceratobasidium theobromae]